MWLLFIDIFKVLMLRNEINLLQIKSKNQENTINIMRQEIEDLKLEHSNEIERIEKELTNNQRLVCHFKGNIIIYINNNVYCYVILFLKTSECYENEANQTKTLTKYTDTNKEYVCQLTTKLNDLEKNSSEILNEYKEYKIEQASIISILTNKLNASEEIVQQLLPGNIFFYVCKFKLKDYKNIFKTHPEQNF